MECSTDRPAVPARAATIDYRQAAERLLVALAFIGGKFPERPVPAVQLCAHAFDYEIRRHWEHESKRRRVREVVDVARKLLIERQQLGGADAGDGKKTLAANGIGYWLTADPQVMTWYANQRRRRGLADLVIAAVIGHAAKTAGQQPLFGVHASSVQEQS